MKEERKEKVVVVVVKVVDHCYWPFRDKKEDKSLPRQH
jgi:hypothetical protein